MKEQLTALEVLQYLNNGVVFDLKDRSDSKALDELRKIRFLDTDQRMLVTGFINEVKRYMGPYDEVLYSAASFQPDLTIQMLSYSSNGQRFLRVALNAMSVDFPELELRQAGEFEKVAEFKKIFECLPLPEDLRASAIGDIYQCVDRIDEFRKSMVTLPGIEPGLHD